MLTRDEIHNELFLTWIRNSAPERNGKIMSKEELRMLETRAYVNYNNCKKMAISITRGVSNYIAMEKGKEYDT